MQLFRGTGRAGDTQETVVCGKTYGVTTLTKGSRKHLEFLVRHFHSFYVKFVEIWRKTR